MGKTASYDIFENTATVDTIAKVMQRITKRCGNWDAQQFARMVDEAEGLIVVGYAASTVVAVAEMPDEGLNAQMIRGRDLDLLRKCCDRIEKAADYDERVKVMGRYKPEDEEAENA